MQGKNGWIKLNRKILDWRWYQEGNTFRVFLHLLLTANVEDAEFKYDTIHRGEVATSIGNLAKSTKLTYSQVRTALDHLKFSNEIAINTRPKYTTRVLKTNRHFIFGTVKEGLVALDRETLDVAWRGKVGSAIAPFAAYSKKPQRCVGTVPVLLPGGVVCAAASDGAVHFWSEADGKHLKEFRTGAPYFADAVLKDGNIYVADAAGYVRCFKA